MARGSYSAAFQTKVVLEVLQGEKELGAIAAEHNLNPNMVRTWKKECLDNAESVFEKSPNLIQKDDELSVRRQCELLGVNRSIVYYEQKKPDRAAVELRERIMGRIDDWHSRKIMGWTKRAGSFDCPGKLRSITA